MKIEMSEPAAWTITGCALFATIIVIVLGVVYIVGKTDQEAIKAGLVEIPNSGNGHHWGKP